MYRAPNASMEGCSGEVALRTGGYSTVVRTGHIASIDSPGVPIAGLDYWRKLMGTTVAETAGRPLRDVRRALGGCRRRVENMDCLSVVRIGPTANIRGMSWKSGQGVQQLSKKRDGHVNSLRCNHTPLGLRLSTTCSASRRCTARQSKYPVLDKFAPAKRRPVISRPSVPQRNSCPIEEGWPAPSSTRSLVACRCRFLRL